MGRVEDEDRVLEVISILRICLEGVGGEKGGVEEYVKDNGCMGRSVKD